MCGIIARISTNNNPIDTLEGIKFLEYRGYDSYGILLYNEGKEILDKNIGALPEKKQQELMKEKSNIEIAHTRWATHGGVTKANAHPHFDKDKKFYVVMNGIIENYLDIKAQLKRKVDFKSESDTEVIPHLYATHFKESKDIEKSLIDCTKKILSMLQGEFSFIVKYKNYVLAYKNINPIIAGVKKDEFLLSSDMGYVQNHSNKYYNLNDDEFVVINLDNEVEYNFYENFNSMKPKWHKSNKTEVDDENKFSTYMEKEIKEEKFVRNIVTSENLSSIKYLKNTLKNKPIVFAAAGTSYHAAYYMHYMLLKQGIGSQVILASELNNYTKVIDNSLIVVFSQSGETADLIYPLKKLRDNNEIFTITNSANSTLDRFASRSVYLNCGREISVASTKAFTSQVFIAYLLKQELTGDDVVHHIDDFEDDFDRVLEKSNDIIDEICKRFMKSKDFFFIGRDSYHPFALEGALKLKEISYIHAEGFAGGELKHGTLALIEDGVPVISLGESSEIISNAIEIKTRGGIIIGIASENNEVYDYFFEIPNYYKGLFATLIMHNLALKMTLALGYSPDRPRNLAKSVTVK